MLHRSDKVRCRVKMQVEITEEWMIEGGQDGEMVREFVVTLLRLCSTSRRYVNNHTMCRLCPFFCGSCLSSSLSSYTHDTLRRCMALAHAPDRNAAANWAAFSSFLLWTRAGAGKALAVVYPRSKLLSTNWQMYVSTLCCHDGTVMQRRNEDCDSLRRSRAEWSPNDRERRSMMRACRDGWEHSMV